MLRKKIAWIILVIGLMMNNIGLAGVIKEDFSQSMIMQNNLYKKTVEKGTEVILIDEEIPGGTLVQKGSQKIMGEELHLIGLTFMLISLGVWKKEVVNQEVMNKE